MLPMSLCAVKLFYWSRVKAGTVGFLGAPQRLYDVSSHCYGDKAETDVPNSSNLALLVWIQFVFLSGCSTAALWLSISHAGNSPPRLPFLLTLSPPHLSAPSCVSFHLSATKEQVHVEWHLRIFGPDQDWTECREAAEAADPGPAAPHRQRDGASAGGTETRAPCHWKKGDWLLRSRSLPFPSAVTFLIRHFHVIATLKQRQGHVFNCWY